MNDVGTRIGGLINNYSIYVIAQTRIMLACNVN